MRSNPILHILMRRAPRFALYTLLFVLAVVARPVLAGESIVNGQGLLWKLERAGLAPNYLFGTIHITDERVLDLPPEVKQAFDGASSATFEIIMTPEVGMKVGKSMVLMDGRTLDGIVGPELFQEVAEVGRRYNLGPDQLKFFKPWALAVIFSVPQSEMGRKAAGDLPLDQWLQAEASRQNKPMHAMETPEEQLAVLSGMSEADQIAMLQSAVEANGKIEAMFETLTQNYLDRDVAAIYNRFVEESEDLGQEYVDTFMTRLNDERNKLMTERLAGRFSEGGAFVAVGALHLIGEQGLVRLFEQQGYSVQRVY